MRIRTQFLITILVFGILLVGISISVLVTNRRVADAIDQEVFATRVAQGASELSYLSNDYVIYHEKPQLDRWQSRFNLFLNDVSGLKASTPEQQVIISSIWANSRFLKEVFDSVVTAVGSSSPGQDGIDVALLQVSWSRMAVQSQGLTTDASRLSQLLRAQANRLTQINLIAILALISIFTVYFVLTYFIVQRRTLRAIAFLRTGTSVIGAGNLDFKLDVKENDEIGDLSRAFNRMTADLKQVTTSKMELEREIEERKGVERALQFERDKLTRIMDAMEDGVCIMDSEFNIEYVNPAMRALFGDVNEKRCYQYFNGRNDVCPRCNNQEVLGGQTLRHEAQISKTGRTYEITDAPLRNADGSISKLAVFHDITERKKVEQLKDEFINMVSHELKTPLTVVMGALSTAVDKRVSKEQAEELLGDAIVHTGILANLVENLLELSRQQSDRLNIQVQPTDVGRVTRGVLQKLQNKSAVHHLANDVPETLLPALVDPIRAERILYNLVDNAIKYSPDGGEVKVSARQEEGYLVVTVSDQGPGISGEDQARLFQSFERLGVTVKGSIQGTGLGLRVCRILVEAHGGKIWVESEKGNGAAFVFTLPVASYH